MEALLRDIQKKILYYYLEHPVAKVVKKQDDFEIIIEEIPDDDDILVRNWRIQIDVKTTRKKLKEVQRIIEEYVKPIL